MTRNRLWLLLAVCALPVLSGCGGGGDEETQTNEAPAEAPAAGAAAVDTANAGKVTGAITYAGPDTDTPIAMNADPTCAGLHSTPVDTNAIALKDGKLGNVFVYVKTGLEGKTFPTPTEKKTIDQQGCLYHPRIQGIQVGQALVIKNSDSTLHNIHALPTANAEFNQSQPFQNMEFEKTFDKQEVMLHFKCDVHPWMSSYIGVLPHPYYAVTGDDGTFTIDKLPPGNYTLEAWHETLGTMTQDITVAANGTATANFDFKPKA
ncbi:MAG TPA: carboxypeptidase regulatory-like domain-containing protein [Thermoanaerobaculia bacterium]|nr:carboxypeptidase regulatory-like domain-containing protein [Thermoanaerobaculia bacterium]